ncbi:hypothetical protein ACZ90_00725 [Streptomyces albus subsp. albus]|nr:hypothetical protein ACZ90_00725 [Streptomyces albus subsp. albus]
MQNARAKVTAMVAALQAHPHVEVLNATLGEAASEAELAEAVRLAGGRLPPGVADFYREIGSFQLDWRHTVETIRQGDLSDHGCVNILPVREVFGDWEGVTWFPSGDQGFRGVKPLDMFVPEACAALLRPPGEMPGDTLAFHYFGEELHDTGYTFDEYLERLLAARGYWYWILTLCPGQEGSVEVEAFRRNMPHIFPDYDDTLFHPRPSV